MQNVVNYTVVDPKRPFVKPTYATEKSVGMDLYASLDKDKIVIFPKEIVLVNTNLAIQMVDGYEAQIRPKSGLALKGITVLNAPGTIDPDYNGEIKVILINLGNNTHIIENKTKIAQIVFSRYESVDLLKVDFLNETERGSGGFGSTGLK